MPQRTATIESLPMAFEVVKQMQADGLEWGEGYRPLCRRALAEIIEGRMAAAVDGWLDGSAVRDRRNGSYSRHLLTELGDIELAVPRSRRFCPTGVLRAYARRSAEIDRAILAGFVLGLSTRKVGEADRDAVLNAADRPRALSAARRFADAREQTYPKGPVACLRNDPSAGSGQALDELLTCFQYKSLAERKQVRTTNAIERRFRKVRRRTRGGGAPRRTIARTDRSGRNRGIF